MAQTQTTTTDSQGRTTTRYYTDGKLVRDSWTDTAGNRGQASYLANGKIDVAYVFYKDGSTRTTYSDGRSEYTETSSSGSTTWYTNAAGQVTGSAANNTDGSSSRTVRNPDNSTTVYTTNADGSRTEYTSDGKGNSSEKRYNKSGALHSESKHFANGDRENIAYGSNGQVATRYVFRANGTVETHNANGSYELTSKNSSGQTITEYFNAQGNRTGRSVDSPNGSSQRVEYGAGGSLTSYDRNANGSYNVVTSDGKGNTTEKRYTASNFLQSESANYADGSRMNAQYNANGSSTTYRFRPNGDYQVSERSSSGVVTSQWYNANGQPINNVAGSTSNSQVDSLVNALASFGAGAGGDSVVTSDANQPTTLFAGSLS